MFIHRYTFLLGILLLPMAASAQLLFTTTPLDNSNLYRKCHCKIDEQAVLTNQNLDSFIQRMQTDSFTTSTDKKAIPKAVSRQLGCLAGQKHFIANPDEYYQKTDVQFKRISPLRQLIYLAKSKDILVMTYRKGSWGGGELIMLIKFNKHGILDFWSGFAEGPLDTNEAVIESIRQRRGKEWGLHTNYVSF